ncbi:MAG: copper chaperone PCu(A)C [Sphingomonadales bacterium]|nr:MAG: copper chaperone PCu(A)C [Sphingomonadales bacterium]
MTPIRLALAAALLVAAPAVHAQTATPQISGGWVRLPPVVSRPAAGYLTIKGGAQADTLLKAEAPFAGRVELHAMKSEGGIMKMIQQDKIDVPANGTVTLAPGGMHLMFFDLKNPPAAGAKATVTLTFAKAGAVSVPVEVRAVTGEPAAKDHGSHH